MTRLHPNRIFYPRADDEKRSKIINLDAHLSAYGEP